VLSPQRHGKRFRPTIVALMARTLAGGDIAAARSTPAYARHSQLGTITEMIHVASLIHDDVLDEAETRRGGMAVHKLYSNKVCGSYSAPALLVCAFCAAEQEYGSVDVV
jgi:geranylgeranyl pyrophosphate synthase